MNVCDLFTHREPCCGAHHQDDRDDHGLDGVGCQQHAHWLGHWHLCLKAGHVLSVSQLCRGICSGHQVKGLGLGGGTGLRLGWDGGTGLRLGLGWRDWTEAGAGMEGLD